MKYICFFIMIIPLWDSFCFDPVDVMLLLSIPILFSFYQSLECGRGAMDDNASVLLPRSFLSISFFTILICFFAVSFSLYSYCDLVCGYFTSFL